MYPAPATRSRPSSSHRFATDFFSFSGTSTLSSFLRSHSARLRRLLRFFTSIFRRLLAQIRVDVFSRFVDSPLSSLPFGFQNGSENLVPASTFPTRHRIHKILIFKVPGQFSAALFAFELYFNVHLHNLPFVWFEPGPDPGAVSVNVSE